MLDKLKEAERLKLCEQHGQEQQQQQGQQAQQPARQQKAVISGISVFFDLEVIQQQPFETLLIRCCPSTLVAFARWYQTVCASPTSLLSA